MKQSKLFFILSLIGILAIIILTQNQNPITGKITSIDYSNNKITIQLENHSNELIIFTSKILNLSINDNIIVEGKQKKYKNETQIIINKIEKLSHSPDKS